MDANFKLCVVCNTLTTEKLVEEMTLESYNTFFDAAMKHKECQNAIFTSLFKVIENCNSGLDLMKKGVRYHRSCRGKVCHKNKLERAQKRYQEDHIEMLKYCNDNLQNKRIKRSDVPRFKSEQCFFCQNVTSELLHAIQSQHRSILLREFAENDENDQYRIHLSAVINQNNALTLGIKYHASCWIKFIVRGKLCAKQYNDSTLVPSIPVSIAKVEFAEVISKILKAGKIISFDEVETAYATINKKYNYILPESKRSIRRILVEQVPDVEFISDENKHKADNIFFKDEKIKAMALAKKLQNFDLEMKNIYHVASVIRKEILNGPKFEFDGLLKGTDTEVLNQHKKLVQLLKWILVGSNISNDEILETSSIDKTVTVIAQMVLYETKSTKQVKHASKSSEISTIKHSKEYPLQVGVGFYLHKQLRSKNIVQFFHSIGLSVDYTRLLRLESSIASSLLETNMASGYYIPSNIAKNKFIYFAADNCDFNEDTIDGKNTLHATAMVAFQEFSENEMHNHCFNFNHNYPFKIPETFGKLSVCNMPQKSQPTCNIYENFSCSNTDCAITLYAKISNFLWFLCHCKTNSNYATSIPLWSTYNSLTSNDDRPLTQVHMMPLINAPAHEWNTLMTILKQAYHITQSVNNNQKTIITFDMQLYEKVIKMQMLKKPDLDNFIFRVGELHVVINALRALGTSIENSGLEDTWVEADLFSSTTVSQILQCKNLKRCLNAHLTCQAALYSVYLPLVLQFYNSKYGELNGLMQFLDNLRHNIELNDQASIKALHKELVDNNVVLNLYQCLIDYDNQQRKVNPVFSFLRDYMAFVDDIYLFIYATRLGIWKLHIKSLKSLVKYFFVYDRQKYARMIPYYLAQMEQLEITDPNIFNEFCKGNFCVKKNNIPFVSIGPDHAIEHVNKLMKIQGGLKGITQQHSAILRWFLIAPELQRLSEETTNMLSSSSTFCQTHHRQSKHIINKFDKNVIQLTKVFKSRNVFNHGEGNLVNITTGAIMSDAVMQSVKQRNIIGEQMFNEFVHNRLVNHIDNFWKVMTKAKFKGWNYSEAQNKVTCMQTKLKDDRSLFARLLIVCRSRPEVDVKEIIGEYEFSMNPRSLFNLDGSLRICTTKSKLIKILELQGSNGPTNISNVQAKLPLTHGAHRVFIVDGMAVMQEMGKPANIINAANLCEHFLKIVEQRAIHFNEIHIIFDRYDLPISLKQHVRDVRTSKKTSLAYCISHDTNIEKIPLQVLLSNATTKQNLASYFAEQIIALKQKSDIVFVTTNRNICLSNKQCFSHLDSSHEEADTRLILHAVDATIRGSSEICINSPDTDVLVLALYRYPMLCNDTYLLMGCGLKQKKVYLSPIYNALPQGIANALLGFHALSGCDYTGSFFGKSKQTCWNALMKCDEDIVNSLSNLGNSLSIVETDMCNIEKLICQIYAVGTKISSMKELRWHLFSKQQFTDEKLPPTQSALQQVIVRSNYVAMIWKNSIYPNPTEPSDPNGNGWVSTDGRYYPITTTQPIAPQFLVDLIKCSCKKGCASNMCTCRANGMNCTDMCANCSDDCHNQLEDTAVKVTESESDCETD